jgi:Spy/CpxP family protein refolding chaperone
MRKKLLIVPVALVLCLAWYGYSNAMMCGHCDPMSGVRGEGGHMMMKWMAPLGLDEKQTAEVKAIHFETMKETIKKRADMAVAEIELRELFLKEPADFKAVEAKVRQIEMLRGDIVILHMKAREETRSKLTAEQRKKFDALTAMPMDRSMPQMGCGMTGRRGLFGGTAGWGAARRGSSGMMDRMGMMRDGMMQMQSDEEAPASVDEMEPDEMPPMEHQEMSH